LASAQNAGTDCSAKVLQNKTEYWGNSYNYDAWGNLLQKSITKCGAENLLVTADAHNWIHASGTDYQYDAAGNMTFDATAGLSYTFDQENRLTGAGGYAYTYDSDGNRVRKSNGNLAASGTLYWSMTPGVVAETDLAGTLKSEYVFFDGERVARRDGATGMGGIFYYFSDHLKTASIITDSAGVIKAESDYYPWGGELQFVNNDSNDYKFTGKKRDVETGLDYFGARYYSNGLGRWVSADWSATPVPVPYADFGDPQSLNLYGFVGGNPASKADADGHCCTLSASSLADAIDSSIDRSVAATQTHASVVPPVVAALDTFVTGSAGDLVKGLTNTLRLGESLSLLPENASTTEKIIAGAEEGGRVGGVILAVVGVAGPKGSPTPEGTAAKGGAALPKEGVYEGPDATAPGKTYVGQSGDIANRVVQHEGSGKFAPGTKVSATEVKGGKTAREVAEHNRIQQLGGVKSKPGSQTSNIRNPIGKNREHLLNKDNK
jgi:RHS repeat-associated protein